MITQDEAARIIAEVTRIDRAAVSEGLNQKPFSIQRVLLDLSTARLEAAPLKLATPFRSIYVSDATDSSATVYLKPYTDDTLQSAVPLMRKDSLSFPRQISASYLHWSAQSGKTMELFLFYDGEFRSGTQQSVQSGSVSVGLGDTLALTDVELTAATAAQIFASDSDRKRGLIQNRTGASIFVGPNNTVTDLTGFEIVVGASFEHDSAAALFGYSAGGGTVRTFVYS